MTAPAPTAPTSRCVSFIGARILRGTLLDVCGRPLWGPASQVVTKGFVSVEIAPQVEEGEAFKLPNAAGELCINDKAPDIVSWYVLTIEFCLVDPALYTMLNRSWKRVTDAARAVATGWRQGEQVTDRLGFSLEMWPKVSGAGAGQACLVAEGEAIDPTLDVNGYILWPWLLAQAPESVTFANAATTFKIKARTRAGSLWGKGPYAVTRDLAGAPAPLLDYIDPGFDVPVWELVTSGDPDHMHTEIVTVAPPVARCGAQGVFNPDATAPVATVAATGGNPLSVTFTVTNFALIGNGGVAHWGDGTSTVITTAATAHAYAALLDDIQQTITFYPANGAAPITRTFTPQTA